MEHNNGDEGLLSSSEDKLGKKKDTSKERLGQIWKRLWKRKSLAEFEHEAALEAKLDITRMTLFDLLCVGIGGTVGSGVFVLTGEVYPVAGPSSALSWCLAGIVCSLSALSYMELSARVPTRGSCYAFSYHSLGELPAVVGAVCLTLEYGLSGAGVARNWSSKLAVLLNRYDVGKYFFFPYDGSVGSVDDGDDDVYFDIPAGVLQVYIHTLEFEKDIQIQMR
jgi:hypothetical protein